MPRPKRKRTSSPSGIPETRLDPPRIPLSRSDVIYMDDGNIVLVAENTAFRVHKSQLASHSEVFRDMFATVHQPIESEIFEDCPVVRLSDRHEDVAQLLQKMYGRVPEFDVNQIGHLISVLRLSTKYQIDPFRRLALKALQQRYPSTLLTWDTDDEDKHSILEIADVIAVARETGTDVLLPSAFYYLTSLTNKEIATSGHLPTLEYQIFTVGKERIMTVFPEFIRDKLLPREPSATCTSRCSKPLKTLGANLLSKLLQMHHFQRPNPLFDLEKVLSTPTCRVLCPSCRSELETDIRLAREETWEKMPEFFDVGTWEELRNAPL